MPVVIRLPECWARPGGDDGVAPLGEHLCAVARQCGVHDGQPGERLAFLAGLLHDVGKCHPAWQAYVRGQLSKGPAHAPLGAALFAWAAEQLVTRWSLPTQETKLLHDLCLDWVRVIYNHHDELEDLDLTPPWERSWSPAELVELLAACDGAGIMELVRSFFPEFTGSPESFSTWVEQYGEHWERRFRIVRPQLRRAASDTAFPFPTSTAPPLRFAQLAGLLVSADRYHAGGFKVTPLSPAQAEQALQKLLESCRTRAAQALKEGASPQLVAARGELQRQAAELYTTCQDARFFSLTLPTGYGKTLTALRVALEAVRMGRCDRIVYVAPYISILSQAANEIAKATGLPVLEHHHLSLLAQKDDQDVEALDSWQAPVVATTFNQLFRVLFPRRAQHTVRSRALQRAFIIIDEPQIINMEVWSLFLYALREACGSWQAQCLLATATLPPLAGSLGEACHPLNGPVTVQRRYRVEFDAQAKNGADVLAELREVLRQQGQVAVVLNTIRDAAQLFINARAKISTHHCCLLTGMMLPAHKSNAIDEVRGRLKHGQPTLVICTQILEAGVDLSFQLLFRALPVFTSVAQAAGRANRHNAGSTATVRVFPFVRDDGKDARPHVYRDVTARRQTDALLAERSLIHEEEMAEALECYFRRCWDENRHAACLTRLERAALGVWSELAGMEPFEQDYARVDVFVPVGREMVPVLASNALTQYSPEGPAALLNRLEDRAFMGALSFDQRKQFMALLHCFSVPLPRHTAEKVAEPVNEWLWRLRDPNMYSPETGLACLLEQDETEDTIV